MKLPAGWSAELPEAVHQKAAYATYDETYRFERGTVYTERKLVVLQKLIPATEWKAYKKFTDSIHLGDEMYIELVRARGEKAEGAAESPAGVKPSNAEAAKLVTQAQAALNNQDLATAKLNLDQAEALNDTQRNLWGSRAALAFRRGEMTEALADYRKEVGFHPEAVWVYAPMAMLQTVQGHPSEAEATLRLWTGAEPASPAAAAALMNQLLVDGKSAEAAAAGKIAMDKIPEGDAARNDTRLLLLYGKSQLKAGMLPAGATTLKALLKDADAPGIRNDAAYELADAGVELPLAEQTVRAALDQMSAESQAWTLNENEMTLLQKSSLIAASWDTLGWVLFREGKLGEAEDIVAASWKNRQSPVVGEHLGDIQSARGEHGPAATSYELAMTALPWINALGVRITAETEDSKRLKGKLGEQKKAGGKPTGDAQAALTHVRTVSLGAAAGRQGVAEYLIMFAEDHGIRARATGEKTVTGGEELLAKGRFAGTFPLGSKARLVHKAMLNCHQAVCEVVFE